MPSRPLAASALCAVACALALPATTTAAAKQPRVPSISSVAPMKLGVGDTLTIRGRNFRSGARRNSVVFKRDGMRAVFVRAGRATSTVLKVKIPTSLLRYLPQVDGKPAASRFRLRVLASRFSRGYTPLRTSPTIGPADATTPAAPGGEGSAIQPGPAPPATLAPPADCDGDGIPDVADGDDDGDLLSDALEVAIRTSPCNADSDSDGMSDGFEYQSAIDLNDGVGSLPWPGKRPYPNALFADADSDYDGDGLGAGQEHALWRYAGPNALPLSYSAGLKRSSGPVPDDARDADGDGLGNWDELGGRMQPAWWKRQHVGEREYPEHYAPPSPIDPDSDGDGVPDGADDQDFDGWTNSREIDRDAARHRVNPYNPCLPDYLSRTCMRHPPFDDPPAPFPLADPPPPAPLTWP